PIRIALIASLTALLVATWTVRAAESAPPLFAYGIEETVTKDSCYPERKVFRRSYPWMVTALEKQFVVLSPQAAILNPIEHPSIRLSGSAQLGKDGLPASPQSGDDTVAMAFSNFGSLTSKLSVSLTFTKDGLQGTFTNRVSFEPGTIGFTGLKLF